MGEFVFRALEPTHLKDRQLSKPRIEPALETDVAADAIERARHIGRIDQQLMQIGIALEHVAIFGRDLVGLEIGQAGHFFLSPSGSRGAPAPGSLFLFDREVEPYLAARVKAVMAALLQAATSSSREEPLIRTWRPRAVITGRPSSIETRSSAIRLSRTLRLRERAGNAGARSAFSVSH